jgi:hypothetical protein
MFSAKRPNGQYVFHDGCDGCPNDLSICPSCCYMERNWDLPDRNPVNIAMERERWEMIKKAKAAARGVLIPEISQ